MELVSQTKDLNIENHDTDAPKRFKYQAFQNSNEFRLIRLVSGSTESLNCYIDVVSLEDTPKYEALSYTWGALVKAERIHCQEGFLDITKNLQSAFLQLRRKNSDRLLWVDAVCVNQDDIAERGQQVQLMQRIFQQAKQVVVWLGETSDDSDLEKIDTGDARVWTIGKYGENIHLPLSWLQHFNRPWFLRVWIIQEVAFARKVIVMHGQQIIPWKDFARVSREYMMKRNRIDDENHPMLNGDLKSAMILPYFISTIHRRLRKQTSIPLLELLDQTNKFKATDLRDKIYALLSITTLDARRSLTPDYGISLSETYINVARYFVLGARSLSFLRHALPLHRHKKLPSWVPDWSHSTERWSLFEREEYSSDEEEETGEKEKYAEILDKSGLAWGMGQGDSNKHLSKIEVGSLNQHQDNRTLMDRHGTVSNGKYAHQVKSAGDDIDENFNAKVSLDLELKTDNVMSCSSRMLTVKGLHVASIATMDTIWIDKNEMEADHEDLVKSLGSWYCLARSHPEYSLDRIKRLIAFWSTVQETNSRNANEEVVFGDVGYEQHLKLNFGTGHEDPASSISSSVEDLYVTSSGSSQDASNGSSPSDSEKHNEIVCNPNSQEELLDCSNVARKSIYDKPSKLFDVNGGDEVSDDDSDDEYVADPDDDSDSDFDSCESDSDDEEEDEDEDGSDEDDWLDQSESEEVDGSNTSSYNSSQVAKLDQYRLAPGNSEEDDLSENGNIPSRKTDSSGPTLASDATVSSDSDGSSTESHTNSCPAKGAWRSDPSTDSDSDSLRSKDHNKSQYPPPLFSRTDPTRPKCKVESSHGYSFSHCGCSCTYIDFEHHLTPHEEAHDLFNPSSPAMHTPQAKRFLRENAAAICGRTFGFTAQGHMVSLPGDAKVTDLVCLFYGLRLPLVIRKVDPGVYELIGGCYIHAKWDWDMFEKEVGVENMESFTLR